MIVGDIIKILERWAPPGSAWERDNVGLQVGQKSSTVRRILLSLDCTEEVVREAVRKKADLIVTHHPLLFHPPKSITESTKAGRIVMNLIRSGISLYASHTNADYVRDGVSKALGYALGLRDMAFLAPLSGRMVKIVTFIPHASVDAVARAMAEAGAGVIGNYTECSFRTEGTGTYTPGAESNPSAGTRGKFERAGETRLEMIAPRWAQREIIAAMASVHPYEEVAYDVYPDEAVNPNFGAGIIGTLPEALPLPRFLGLVKRVVARDGFRYAAGRNNSVHRVAVCGGSGSEYLKDAIGAGADAFITADVTYHTFQDAEGVLTLIDAGHFETERFILPTIDRVLRESMTGRNSCAVSMSKVRVNSINYY